MLRGPIQEPVTADDASRFVAVTQQALTYADKHVWAKLIAGNEKNPKGELVCRDVLKYILVLLASTPNVDEQDFEEFIMDPEAFEGEGKVRKLEAPQIEALRRLIVLFNLAEEMQIKRGGNAGNFYKKWGDRNVRGYDPEKVFEFCMRSIAVIWKEYGERLPESIRAMLKRMMTNCVGLVKNCNTPPKYTNMYLMNIFNLIQLGDILEDKDATAAGYAQFDRFMIYTWEWGIHEYSSPVYTAVQLDTVMMLERFCDLKKEHAKALLEFYWVYVALNWIPNLNRIGGAESRQISDYFNNEGNLNIIMQALGVGDGHTEVGLMAVYTTMTRWKPSKALMDAANKRGIVRHTWGSLLDQSRTMCVLDDVGLSVSGDTFDIHASPDSPEFGTSPLGGYAESEDVLLSADFRNYSGDKNKKTGRKKTTDRDGSKDSIAEHYPGRMYFMPDNDNDPYGRKNHVHMDPTHWAASQSFVDALCLALYAPHNSKDLGSLDGPQLYSHFVLPVAETWIGRKRVKSKPDKSKKTVMVGESVVLFYKNDTSNEDGQDHEDPPTYTALGLKVLWAGDWAGKDIADTDNLIACHFESEKKGQVVRLTVNHAVGNEPTGTAGVVAWVRVGSNLSKKMRTPWRHAFSAAKANPKDLVVERYDFSMNRYVNDDPNAGLESFQLIRRIGVRVVDAIGGPLSIDSQLNWDGIKYLTTVDPPFSQSVLEWDYSDVGRECLRDAPLIQRYEKSFEGVEKVILPEIGTVRWEAEQGQVWLPMVSAWESHTPPKPSIPLNLRPLGHWYVWMDPNSVSTWQLGSDVGNVGWRLQVPEQGGRYYFFARVKTTSKEGGAFMVRFFQGKEKQSLIFQAPWEVGPHNEWNIVSMVLGKENFAAIRPLPLPTRLDLPPGDLTLQLFALKWGTQIDCLYASTHDVLKEQEPELDALKKTLNFKIEPIGINPKKY